MIQNCQLDSLAPDDLGRIRWNATPELLDEYPALAAYQVNPSPLERVWAGDDPADPTLTVALRFDTAEEAGTALAPFNI
jgi:hypothetical protein